MPLVYLDSSAWVKLVVSEPESTALIERLREWPQRVSSALALTELPRALARAGFGVVEHRRARAILGRLDLLDVDRRILATAAALEPTSLRTLDAIHVASAQLFAARVSMPGLTFVSADKRQTEAAVAVGLLVRHIE